MAVLFALVMTAVFPAYAAKAADLGLNAETKEATKFTEEINDGVYALLDFDDKSEVENANRGLIAAPKSLEIKDKSGKVVWSQDAYAFLDKDAPKTANPSLWRNTQLNHVYGLFEVVDGIYQVRGYDMTNITFIKGDDSCLAKLVDAVTVFNDYRFFEIIGP